MKKETDVTKPKILIPLDGSAFSEQILPYVRRLFHPEQAVLLLFKVGAPPEDQSDPQLREVSGRPATGVYAPRGPQPAEHVEELGPDKEGEPAVYEGQLVESQVMEARDDMRRAGQMLEADGFEIYYAARLGDDPAEKIVSFAADEEVDLIAMATHGRSGLDRLFSGSVAEEVLRNVPVPVMLLHREEAET